MTIDQENNLPNVAETLAGVLRNIDPKLQPFLLAKLERLAAHRYRTWASSHPDQSVKEGLLACADREDETARRVESLEPNASAIQDKLFSDNPELLDLNRTLFEGRPLEVQFAMQADGERAGAAAWRAYARLGSSDRIMTERQHVHGMPHFLKRKKREADEASLSNNHSVCKTYFSSTRIISAGLPDVF